MDDVVEICKQAHAQIKQMGITHRCDCGQEFRDVYELEAHRWRYHD